MDISYKYIFVKFTKNGKITFVYVFQKLETHTYLTKILQQTQHHFPYNLQQQHVSNK